MSVVHPSFILSRHWQDTPDGIELRYWLCNDRGSECLTLSQQRSVCFVAASQLEQWRQVWKRQDVQIEAGSKEFQTLMGEVAVAVYTPSYSAQRRWVWQGKDLGLKVWEDDVNPADRFLMERFLFGSMQGADERFKPAQCEPDLKVLSIDIETQWYTPGQTPDLFSVALAGQDLNSVFIVAAEDQLPASDLPAGCCVVASVTECLQRTINTIAEYDPDCIVGWNLIDFDLHILQQHCDEQKIPFAIGRDSSAPRWRSQADNRERFYVDIEGRQVVDGPGAFRSAAWAFDDYSLETVARTLLDRGKQIEHEDDRVGEIERMYRQDLTALARYNLEDARLVIDLFDIAGLWHFLVERAHLTGLPMDRAGGSSAAFNTVYMPRLHREGIIATSVGEQTLQLASPGGFVMDSLPGLYRNVLVLDFKSLYPSIIRTFLIDPLGLCRGLASPESETIPGFLDARFHRTEHILPSLIDQLWQARDQAKAEGNAPMSQAIKIIMNSFYGVLGSNLCRFFDPRLASSITMRGHEILQRTKALIEELGYQVIYGDTDSVFVAAERHLEPEKLGQTLALHLNDWWQQHIQQRFGLQSHLEIEFETHYHQFVMPTIRGTEKGSKKRYAGWIEQSGAPRLVFKGLEAVRSDWTVMAKQFQTELYRRIFSGEDYRLFIVDTVQQLKSGNLDQQLVYRRRLRRSIDQYDKQLPPHVQAASLKRQHQPKWRGRTIEYVKTVQGWQPLPFVTAALDYDHYVEKQLAPIADAILHFNGESFGELIDDQMSLF